MRFGKKLLWGWVLCLPLTLLAKGEIRDPAQLWVDSVWVHLSVEQQIAQLIVLSVDDELPGRDKRSVWEEVEQYGLSGLIAENKGVYAFAKSQYTPTRVPLLKGLYTRPSSPLMPEYEYRFPKKATLAAVRYDSLLTELGYLMGQHSKKYGAHFSWNPWQTVGAYDSENQLDTWGEEERLRATKISATLDGMLSAGQLGLIQLQATPTTEPWESPQRGLDILADRAIQLRSAMLIAAVPTVMLTSGNDTQLTSHRDAWRRPLGYQGLVLLGTPQKQLSEEEVLAALDADIDLFLNPEDPGRCIALIKAAMETGRFSQYELRKRVSRILRLKYHVKRKTKKFPETIRRSQIQSLGDQLYTQSLTLLKNEHQLLPLGSLQNRRILHLQIGGKGNSDLAHRLETYAPVSSVYLRSFFNLGEVEALKTRLLSYSTVIVSCYPTPGDNFDRTRELNALAYLLNSSEKEIIYALLSPKDWIPAFEAGNALLLGYEPHSQVEEGLATAIFGGLRLTGHLPFTLSPRILAGAGLLQTRITRPGYTTPSAVGMQEEVLARLDPLAQQYIDSEIIPGCAILAARGTDIVYAKGFGTLEGKRGQTAVNPFLHTYDLASITKVAATTLSAMKLYEQGKLDLDVPLSQYLPELVGTNKSKITPRALLQHRAGLRSWISLVPKTFSSTGVLDPDLYSYAQYGPFQLALSPSLYLRESFPDTVWKRIVASPVYRSKRYRYSDLSMLLMARLVERLSGMPLDVYAEQHFYKPLGMDHTYFNPAWKGKEAYCPPTEIDTRWRKGQVQGYVHDPTAALMGGVAGHAGLFSNVYDLAKLLFMLKHGGTYGGQRYLRPETIRTFTQRQGPYIRKGLGWDKPVWHRRQRASSVSSYASSETFGHTGFTGTAVWVDPEQDLLIIFLSNRTFPTMRRNTRAVKSLRRKVMDIVYESIRASGYAEKGRSVAN